MSLSVLLVDDDAAFLRALVRALRAEDTIEIVVAHDAPEALALMDQRTIDVIVTDIDMPGISGLELLTIVRREHPDVLRMMITGQATTDRAIAAINEGEVARFFVKPFSAKLLRETLLSFRDRIARVRRETIERRDRAREEALVAWAEKTFPGVTEIARDRDGAMIVDRSADALVFGPRLRGRAAP